MLHMLNDFVSAAFSLADALLANPHYAAMAVIAGGSAFSLGKSAFRALRARDNSLHNIGTRPGADAAALGIGRPLPDSCEEGEGRVSEGMLYDPRLQTLIEQRGLMDVAD